VADSTAGVTGLRIALSGGLDSTVLLVALAEAMQVSGNALPPLRALHVDHGLHPDSAAWTESCRRLAANWSIPFESVRVLARADQGQSRRRRRGTRGTTPCVNGCSRARCCWTAHHADDQVETVLLQWLRGGGLRAIAGMPAMAPFGDHSWHARPLLPFTRAELLAWAEQRHLQWQEDPSNADTRFDRNYLRVRCCPHCAGRWPAVARTIGRVAQYAREGVEAEAELAARDLAEIRVGVALDCARLRHLPDARQRAVLRAWLRALGLPLPSAQTLAALRRDMVAAAADRNPTIDWPGAVVHRYRDRLHAMPREQRPWSTGDWEPAAISRYVLSEHAALELVPGHGVGLSRARLPATLRVVRRAGGERFIPAGSAHRRPLRKWLQERDVLPWRRNELPLIFAGHLLVAIGDLGYAAEYAALKEEPSFRLVWHGRGAVTETDALRFSWRGAPPTG
jgi:tRNA(Ile)-lysidine synthase